MQTGCRKEITGTGGEKAEKGQTIAQIADALEESEAKIREVVDSLPEGLSNS